MTLFASILLYSLANLFILLGIYGLASHIYYMSPWFPYVAFFMAGINLFLAAILFYKYKKNDSNSNNTPI